MRVICIDDSNKPARVPESAWIKEGECYTVIDSYPTDICGMAYKLAEVDYPDYEIAGQKMGGYRANRFTVLSGEKSLAFEDVAMEVHHDEIYK
jgi:hypothetical protein